jgi:hypothetical protein
MVLPAAVVIVPPVAEKLGPLGPPLRLPNPNPLPAEPAPIILVKIGLI